MRTTIFSLVGFIFALLGLGAAGYFWRRAASLYALLVEGASRYEDLQKTAQRQAAELNIANERLTQNREVVARMEKSVDDSRSRLAAMARQLEAKEQEQLHVTEKLELQKNHLLKQLDVLNSRVETLTTAKDALAAELEQVTKQAQTKWQNENAALKTALRQAKSEAEAAQRRTEAAEAKASTASEEEIRTLRRRLAQAERLFNSMKGLRELADERSRNLETAVRKLATHTLVTGGRLARDHQENSTASATPENLGPLVGEALELIGTGLIEEQPSDLL